MQVKRFRASSMQEALNAVRKELGDDAVILKSGIAQNSGFFDFLKRDSVEVVAAVDAPPKSRVSGSTSREQMKSGGGRLGYFADKPYSRAGANRIDSQKKKITSTAKHGFFGVLNQQLSSVNRKNVQLKGKGSMRKRQRGVNDRKRRIIEADFSRKRNVFLQKSEIYQKQNIELLRKEVKELRSIVKTISGHLDPARGVSLRDFADMPTSLAQETILMMECGIEKDIAKTLIERASALIPVDCIHDKNLLREVFVQEITKMIKTAGPIKCTKGRKKVIALVGPTGVGKTTTLAKLAANSKFVFDKNVSLISADTYRMSAIEHLNTFAGIAHLPLSAVYSPTELKACLSAQHDKDIIFIDTAGRSPKDEKHLLELKQFMACANPDEIHLVLPANIKNSDLIQVIRRFNILPINRIVVSKIDETNALGSILNIATEVKYPISYITNGQTIPDDIELANSQNLARLIMRAA